MTISTTESRISYSGNGITTAFAFPYPFTAQADLVVILVDADGTETTQTLTTHYTVAGAGGASGTVTMLTAPSATQTLVIYREVDITQETDYITGDAFPAETHEAALDKLTQIAQQINTKTGRVVRLSEGDTATDVVLPLPTADYYWKWDSLGTGITFVAASSGLADAASVTYTPAGTGAVATDVQTKLRESISVLDFGADNTGTTECSAEIQAAINAAEATTYGARVYLPAGRYLVDTTLTIDSDEVEIVGAGKGVTEIFRETDHGDTFFFTGDDTTGDTVQYVGIRDLKIRDNNYSMTSGAHIHFNGVARAIVHNVECFFGWGAYKFVASTQLSLFNIQSYQTVNQSGGHSNRTLCEFGTNTNYTAASCGSVYLNDFNFRGSGSTAVGGLFDYAIKIDSADGIWMTNGHLGGADDALILLDAAQTDPIGLLFINNVMLDKTYGNGIQFNGSTSKGRNIHFGDVHVNGGTGTITLSTFTADAGLDTLTAATHGFSDNEQVRLESTTTLPAGLATLTTYYIVNADTNTFQLATTPDGTPINITDAGTGTHSVSYTYANVGIKVNSGADFKNVTFNDVVVSQFYEEGVDIQSTAFNHVTFDNLTVSDCSISGSGDYDGIYIGAGVQYVSFIGGAVGYNRTADTPPDTALHQYGIFVQNTADITIDGMDLRGNQAPINAATALGTVARNIIMDSADYAETLSSTTLTPKIGVDFVNLTLDSNNLQTISQGHQGEKMTIYFVDATANVINDTGNIVLSGSADWTVAAGDTLSLIYVSPNWIEIGRGDN